MSRPLTAAQLADALGYFSNTIISAMHHGTATEACIAQGIDAVAGRLEEIGGPPPPPPPPEANMMLEAAYWRDPIQVLSGATWGVVFGVVGFLLGRL